MKHGKSNQLRVIGGSHRSRIVYFPNHENLRPTADRIRETLFNWLQNDIYGAQCLDLFAGSGILGIEALSRGAAKVHFVESAPAVVAAIEDNLAKLELQQASVSMSTAENWLESFPSKSWCDILFLDPPYADNSLATICDAIEKSGILKATAKIYIENNASILELQLPKSWQQLKTKKAGQVYYYLYSAESN